METKEQNIPNNTLEQQAIRLKKQRRRQRVASAFGILILLVGLIQIVQLFTDYRLLPVERNQ